jgi:hypothetical protein
VLHQCPGDDSVLLWCFALSRGAGKGPAPFPAKPVEPARRDLGHDGNADAMMNPCAMRPPALLRLQEPYGLLQGDEDTGAASGIASGPGRVPRVIALALAGETGKGATLVVQLGPTLPTIAFEALPEPVRIV